MITNFWRSKMKERIDMVVVIDRKVGYQDEKEKR